MEEERTRSPEEGTRSAQGRTTSKRQMVSFLSSDPVLSPVTPSCNPLTTLLLALNLGACHCHFPVTRRQPMYMKGPPKSSVQQPASNRGLGRMDQGGFQRPVPHQPQSYRPDFLKAHFSLSPLPSPSSTERILLKLSKITSLWAETKHV